MLNVKLSFDSFFSFNTQRDSVLKYEICVKFCQFCMLSHFDVVLIKFKVWKHAPLVEMPTTESSIYYMYPHITLLQSTLVFVL